MKVVNIIIADDHRLFADGVEQIINLLKDLRLLEYPKTEKHFYTN